MSIVIVLVVGEVSFILFSFIKRKDGFRKRLIFILVLTVFTTVGFVSSTKKIENYIKIDFNNPNSLVNCYSALLNKFPNRNIVVTLGDKGAMYLMDNQIKVMPGLKVNEVDATGAKDIFCGSFAYALLKGYDIEKTVTFANIASGLSVVKIGGRSSIPEYDEIMKYFLQKYPDEGTIQKETPPVIATEAGM